MNQPDSTPAKYGVIESGIPIPQRKRGPESHSQFRKMNAGDSMILRGSYQSVCGKVYYAKRKTGFKFTIRKVSETETRVWRTA